jgi:sigma-54-specific transcriptional regulator
MSDIHPAKLLSFPVPGESKDPLLARPWVSRDPRAEQIARQLERLAPYDASVLIVGETGTGKEIAARYLHEHSRAPAAFVAVNCGAFSDSLIDAELFGHEVGAFTGAQQARAGWFEAANGGTLFLDEIGDMPLHLQTKLLRVLQERQVVRLGSRKPIAVDVRVIAATNVELVSAVHAGRFRSDLYYRLNVASVRLLALRERPGDIVPLAQHFIELYRRKLGLGRVALSSAAERALLAHSWPGNIRELENVMHCALIVCRNGVLDSSDLQVSAAPAMGQGVLDTLCESLRRLLRSDRDAVYESVERLLLTTAFEYCEGNQVRTARRLGLSRNVVRAQLKRFGLLGDDDAVAAR